jgi:outer membrane protein OmpA-like peptidoglycan-associated protein/tetratricopeptide (TPR) repeat protein
MKNHRTPLLIILFCLSAYLTRAQQYDPDKVNKKAAQLNSKGLEQAEGGDLNGGIQSLQEAIRIDKGFEDAYLSIAGIYGEMKNYRKAVEYYQKAKAIDSAYFLDFALPYSIDLAGTGNFAAALQAVDSFLTIPTLNETSRKAGTYRQSCYQFALDYAAGHPASNNYQFTPINLGDSINSNVSEYFPAISLDGNTLVFTRRVNGTNEDFYESTRSGGVWGMAHSLPGNINTNQNEGAECVSQDGQWLIFNGCNYPDGMGSCDLYISYLTADGWSTPENMGDSINTEFWETAPSLSPDKRDLYFTSNRPGGYGGSDIYVSHRLLNGQWSEAENLGPTINTIGDEGTPFIHADNQTLYFNSTGQPGYGDNDLFVSRKQPDGTWGKPENLGYPINTIDDQGSLVVAADGKTAYYASDKADTKGGLDLYTFTLREDIRPAKTNWVKGKVFDRSTNKGLPSSVILTDLATRAIISNLQTDETGNYLITLPEGKDYAFTVKRRGYLFFSENFSLSHDHGDTAYTIDIPLQPLEANATIVLKNIFFDPNKYNLMPESDAELDQVVQLMKDNPTLKIQINGHTDNSGNAADNITLSENRARAVTTYLIARGIAATRLVAKGWGDTKPISDNSTPEGRAKNRRTELTVISR